MKAALNAWKHYPGIGAGLESFPGNPVGHAPAPLVRIRGAGPKLNPPTETTCKGILTPITESSSGPAVTSARP